MVGVYVGDVGYNYWLKYNCIITVTPLPFSYWIYYLLFVLLWNWKTFSILLLCMHA